MYFICERCHHIFEGLQPKCSQCGAFHMISEAYLRQLITGYTKLLDLIELHNLKSSVDEARG
jgi:predicted ATP-dependent serine protease